MTAAAAPIRIETSRIGSSSNRPSMPNNSKKPPSLSPAALRTAQKEAPATLEGAHGAEGLLWAEHVRTLDYALDTSAAALARALTSASRKMVLRARFQILLLHPSVNLKRRASLVSLTTGLVTTQR